MRIHNQKGVVSNIMFSSRDTISVLPKRVSRLLSEAGRSSFITPSNRLDGFDESILTFDDSLQALFFLTSVVRMASRVETRSRFALDIRLSLCIGDYFIHDDQIYGDAVNRATRLTYSSSADNEMIVCGVDPRIINDFVNSNRDVFEVVEFAQSDCVAIRMVDNDCTVIRFDAPGLKVDFNNRRKIFDVACARKLSIGRADDCDIRIDNDQISRYHATLKLDGDKLVIEDHSANGSYLYVDEREIFLIGEALELAHHGRIAFGNRMTHAGLDDANVISYSLTSLTSLTSH